MERRPPREIGFKQKPSFSLLISYPFWKRKSLQQWKGTSIYILLSRSKSLIRLLDLDAWPTLSWLSITLLRKCHWLTLNVRIHANHLKAIGFRLHGISLLGKEYQTNYQPFQELLHSLFECYIYDSSIHHYQGGKTTSNDFQEDNKC